jgi:hypothetical protein
MSACYVFHDPFFSKTITELANGISISFPVVEIDILAEVIQQLKSNAVSYFSSHTSLEIMEITDKVDSVFTDSDSKENRELAENIRLSSGFSEHDIQKYGLGIFAAFCNSDRDKRGYYINKSLRNKDLIETSAGYLKRFGTLNFFAKWKEPELISHFISGNVVGYTAVLSKIGLPVKDSGAGQILKLPSASSFFPLYYLEKLAEVDSDLRNTMSCAYWKGGDNNVEQTILKQSDTINILSSDFTIKDLKRRSALYNKKLNILEHGHKIGFAYISKEFLQNAEWLEATLNGLVKDISAFDGGACYNVKNVFVQGDHEQFAELLFIKMENFARQISPVSAQNKPTGISLYQVFKGDNSILSSEEKSAFIRVKNQAEFWKPDELYRYVQVMRVVNEQEVYQTIRNERRYLQTAIIAVPDEKIVPLLLLFGKAGISNLHYPGSAALLNAYEEPHDGDFDSVRARMNYKARFAASNFKTNRDWLYQ